MAKRNLGSTNIGSPSKEPCVRDSASRLSPSEIRQPEQKVTVQALLTSLSPTKKNETYFQGELTDGTKVIPLIGFEKTHRKKL